MSKSIRIFLATIIVLMMLAGAVAILLFGVKAEEFWPQRRAVAAIQLDEAQDAQADAIAKLRLVGAVEEAFWHCVKPGSEAERNGDLRLLKPKVRIYVRDTDSYTPGLFPKLYNHKNIKHYYSAAKPVWGELAATAPESVRAVGESRGDLLILEAAGILFGDNSSWMTGHMIGANGMFAFNLTRPDLVKSTPWRAECIALRDAYGPTLQGQLDTYFQTFDVSETPWLPGQSEWEALKAAGWGGTNGNGPQDAMAGLRD